MPRAWIAGVLLMTLCLPAYTQQTAERSDAAPSPSGPPPGPTVTEVAPQPEREPLFDRIVDRARTLAAKPYLVPSEDLPSALERLDYQGYRDIRFRQERALWGDRAGFAVEFFHPGFLYRQPVTIHEVVDGEVRAVPFDPGLFDYGRQGALDLPGDLGFAGFRLHYPVRDARYKDEVIAFLGASYFRMVGRGQHYGLSARGLAVNTAMPEGEEFPRFTEFWLVRPDPESNRVRFYALLDSESVSGAYAFDLTSSLDTVLNVHARLFARSDVQKLGVAPLTSMFAWGENRSRRFDDYRPEVHDSDGLMQHTGAGEWIWRPLMNPRSLQVSALLDDHLGGFGLAQRDRSFESYQDPESRYGARPGVWVTPGGGDWGKGSVQLVEIPTSDETNDNIVAFWVDDRPFMAGESRRYDYQLRTFGILPNPDGLAQVIATRTGWGHIPGSDQVPPRSVRQFVIDFEGGELSGLAPSQPVAADVSIDGGEARTVTVAKLPERDAWRAAFKLYPAERVDKVILHLFLTLGGRRLSETWSYLWDPGALEGG